MHNAIAQHPLNHDQWLPPTSANPTVLYCHVMPRGMGYPFGQLGSAFLVLSSSSSLCTASPLTARHCEKHRSAWLCLSTAQQQLKHWCVISTVLILNPKHSTNSDAEEN